MTNRNRSISTVLLGTLLWAGLAGACSKNKRTGPAPEPGSPVIAIYAGDGAWAESVTAGRVMFEWMGYETELVGPADFNGNDAFGFDAIYFPGGDMYEYSYDISSVGKTRIRSFVSGGGAYVGVCGGAYFASTSVRWRGAELVMEPLGMFKGTASGPIDAIAAYPAYEMCGVYVPGHDHPITEGQPDRFAALYYWGPALVPDAGATVSILGRYEVGDQPAMVAFEYGAGRVFIIGVHPEIEEDSDRDSVAFGDDLDDEGSEWVIMKAALEWCLRR